MNKEGEKRKIKEFQMEKKMKEISTEFFDKANIGSMSLLLKK